MKTKTSMLNYCKTILEAVSFDQGLFRKEYRKSLIWLSNEEKSKLKHWVRNEFTQPNILKQ